MRSSTKITRKYQFLYMLSRFGIAIAVSTLVQLLITANSYGSTWFRILSGIIFSLYFAFMIFDAAATLSKLDNKDYTPLKYDIKWSVMWGVMISAISVIAIVLFIINWHFGDPVSVVLNIIFYIIESPYLAFIMMTPKSIPAFIVILSIVLPVLTSVLGYICGKREFVISDKIYSLVFEKRKKDI